MLEKTVVEYLFILFPPLFPALSYIFLLPPYVFQLVPCSTSTGELQVLVVLVVVLLVVLAVLVVLVALVVVLAVLYTSTPFLAVLILSSPLTWLLYHLAPRVIRR